MDYENEELIKKYHWGICRCFNRKTTYIPAYYVSAGNKYNIPNAPKTILQHRLLMNFPKNMVVDHKNGDSMDNRKANLRVCTRAENRINNGMSIHNKSGVTGVCWVEAVNKWKAYIMLHRKNINLGFFDDKDEAIKIRREAEDKYFGEFARNNSVTEDNKLVG